jgi:serine/threonine protein phosphatase PrpC
MLEIAYDQSIGSRQEQEDYFATISLDHGELVVLADGMGGYDGGKVASSLIVKTVISSLKACEHNTPECFKEALFDAHEALKKQIEQSPELSKMGATLIIAYITEEAISWLSIGDSLIYVLRDNALLRLNELHTYASTLEAMVEKDLITPEEAFNHPNKNHLTSAVTNQMIEQYELNRYALQRDDLIIVASDGLQSLTPDEICQFSDTLDLKALVDLWFQLILEKDNIHQDNTTIIAIQGKQS